MWLLPAILGVAMLLSCSGESARVKTEEPRGSDQTGSAAIEFAPPSPETIPGSQLGEQIRLGYQIVVNTQKYARPYVGNRLNCTNCHLDGGLNPNAASFVGLAAVYPEYRARNARVNTLADRVNECFERSLNGRALPPDSSKLQAVVAYITWLSRGVPSGATLPWRGLQRIDSRRPLDPGQRGESVCEQMCLLSRLRRPGDDGGAAGLGAAVLHHCRRHGTGERCRCLHQIEYAACPWLEPVG